MTIEQLIVDLQLHLQEVESDAARTKEALRALGALPALPGERLEQALQDVRDHPMTTRSATSMRILGTPKRLTHAFARLEAGGLIERVGTSAYVAVEPTRRG